MEDELLDAFFIDTALRLQPLDAGENNPMMFSPHLAKGTGGDDVGHCVGISKYFGISGILGMCV